MDKKFKFAVISTGWWAGFQIPAWFEVGGVDLVALYNRTVPKAEKYAHQYNVPHVYGNLEELFQREKLDFVDIISGNDVHEEMVLLAAKYKVPVICQKPIAPTWEACLNMRRACKEAGIPYMIHENLRWQAPIREVKKLIQEGKIGKPYRGNVNLIGYSAMEYIEQPFLKELPQLSLMDIGSHVLDTARFFFGEASSIYCQHLRSRDDIKGEDVATIVMKMGDVICTVETSNATRTSHNHYPEVLVFIEGTKGSLELSTDFYLKINTDEGSLVYRVDPPMYSWIRHDQPHWHASIAQCNADCLKEIKTGQPAETTADDNMKTMNLVFKAYESAKLNQVIYI